MDDEWKWVDKRSSTRVVVQLQEGSQSQISFRMGTVICRIIPAEFILTLRSCSTHSGNCIFLPTDVRADAFYRYAMRVSQNNIHVSEKLRTMQSRANRFDIVRWVISCYLFRPKICQRGISVKFVLLALLFALADWLIKVTFELLVKYID